MTTTITTIIVCPGRNGDRILHRGGDARQCGRCGFRFTIDAAGVGSNVFTRWLASRRGRPSNARGECPDDRTTDEAARRQGTAESIVTGPPVVNIHQVHRRPDSMITTDDENRPDDRFDAQGDAVEPEDTHDPRFASDPLTVRGTPRKNAPKCTPEEREERIEWIRGLVRLNFNAGDIKRMGARKWNLKRKTVQEYISFARERNRNSLDDSEDQMLADALSYWSKKQQMAEAKIKREREIESKTHATLEATNKEIDEIESELTPDNPQTDRLEILEMRRRSSITLIEHCRRATFSAEQTSQDSQREIDRLKGNHRPQKFARTTKDGQDVDRAAGDPVTMADCDREIRELADKLRARDKPSAN